MDLVQRRFNRFERTTWRLLDEGLWVERRTPSSRVVETIPYSAIGADRVEIEQRSIKALVATLLFGLCFLLVLVLYVTEDRHKDLSAVLFWAAGVLVAGVIWQYSRVSLVGFSGPHPVLVWAETPDRETVETFLQALQDRCQEGPRPIGNAGSAASGPAQRN